MSKIEENNKMELETPLEENLDSEEECTFKQKVFRIIKKPLFIGALLVVMVAAIGFRQNWHKTLSDFVFNKSGSQSLTAKEARKAADIAGEAAQRAEEAAVKIEEAESKILKDQQLQ